MRALAYESPGRLMRHRIDGIQAYATFGDAAHTGALKVIITPEGART